MHILIAKLDATGDVVRTTCLLRRFDNAQVTWLTSTRNLVLLQSVATNLRCISWDVREPIRDEHYDLVINLEDSSDVAHFLSNLKAEEWFGAYVNKQGRLSYTASSQSWFDMSLISCHGRERADELKLKNRRTYQELIFEGLGFVFGGEKYLLPPPNITDLTGDVAIACEAGPVWPMKQWAHYDELKEQLQEQGLSVNVVPRRQSLLEHLGDIAGHRCLISGDSLPMHFALGLDIPCVTLFNCTSPWEIYDYGTQTKLVSPVLEQFFYKRGYDSRATTAITLPEVFEAVSSIVGPGRRAAHGDQPNNEPVAVLPLPSR